MEEKVLGLDLGSNSIGWALAQGGGTISAGVHIFPEGVENLGDGENEKSQNAQRSEYRRARRQTFRRRLRKGLLLKVLSELKMAPLSKEDLKQPHAQLLKSDSMQVWLKQNPYELREKALRTALTREELGRIFYHFIQRRGFLSNSRQASTDNDGAILKGDPKAGKTGISDTQEQIDVSASTLGAYLHSIYPEENRSYQNGQPRIRNRYTDRSMYVEEFKAIWQKQAPHLGLDKETYSLKHVRCLNNPETKRNRRKLKRLQGKAHRLEPLSEGGYRLIVEEEVPLETFFGNEKKGRLFYRRPLRSQKGRIGKCTFEINKPRCVESRPIAEYVRVYQFVNNIEYNREPLPSEQREKAARFLLQLKVSKKDALQAPKFKKLAKHLGCTIEKCNYDSEYTCPYGHTVSQLADTCVFGDDWFDFSEEKQEDIWHSLYFFDDKDKLRAHAQKHWAMDKAQAEQFAEVRLLKLRDDYAQLSRKAMRNVLPFLRAGYVYSAATALGGVRNAFGTRWKTLSEEERTFICTNVPEIVAKHGKGSYLEPLRKWLSEEFSVSEEDLQRLYHHSVKEVAEQKCKWPTEGEDGKKASQEIQNLRNPVVSTVLFQLRKLVKAIIDKHGCPDRIKVELARDLKRNRKQRNEIQIKQNQQEKERKNARNELQGKEPLSEDNILRYRLWKEAGQKCVYSGKNIGWHDLFSSRVQIDHIHPYSRSLDDSFINKVVCFTEENRNKGNRTPYEWQGGDERTWETFKQRALTMFSTNKDFPDRYTKCKRLTSEKLKEGFTGSQLTDTAYASRKAREYLQQICEKVDAVPGMVTAKLRGIWGLNAILHSLDKHSEHILQEENEDRKEFLRRRGEIYGKKNRYDHRHHALDAIVLAFATASQVKGLSEMNRDKKNNKQEQSEEETQKTQKRFPAPTEHFWHQAKEAMAQILVPHKKERRSKTVLSQRKSKVKKNGQTYTSKSFSVRGQLHEDTLYGKPKSPKLEKVYHRRKPLEMLSTRKQVEKIVDARVRGCVHTAVEHAGGYDANGNIPKNAFFEYKKDENGTQIRKPNVFLPNKNGDDVPVRKVRMRETINNAKELKKGQHVNPGSNHHAIVYKDSEGQLKYDVLSFWEVVERVQQGGRMFQMPPEGVEEVARLQINDMFLLGLPEDLQHSTDKEALSPYLYKVQKLSGTKKNFIFDFRRHMDARPAKEAIKEYISIKSFGDGKVGWLRYRPIKVHIDILGHITRHD